MSNYIELPYPSEEIHKKDLAIINAADFLKAIEASEVSSFISCYRIKDETRREIVVFDIHVPLGQKPVNDIRYRERIAVLFEKEDNFYPWVFALRDDFPKVSHLNLWEFEKPRSLCIYEENYKEAKHKWRFSQFIEDISTWLYLTAYNRLHNEDQPLEPFLCWTEGKIVLPKDLKEDNELHIYGITKTDRDINLLASTQKFPNLHPFSCQFIHIAGSLQESGLIKKHPRTLYDLGEFLKEAGIDLFKLLKDKLKEFKDTPDHKLLLLTTLPKSKTKEKGIAGFDHYAFITIDEIEKIGIQLNIWEKQENGLGDVLFEDLNTENSKKIKVGVLRPYLEFNKDQASLFSDASDIVQRINICQIGLGALGANIFQSLSRMGYGKWKLIDKDILLPHNLARHPLGKRHVLSSKSEMISLETNEFINEKEHSQAIWDDILRPANPELINKSLKEADVILDVSTSIAVAREVTEEKYGNGRRISVYLNHSGKDLVILAEDKERKLTLDSIEFQFYRELVHHPFIFNHFQQESGIVRYSNSCRDISSRIPNDHITLHASIASNAIRQIFDQEKSQVSLWRIKKDFSVNHYPINVFNTKHIFQGEWEIVIDSWLIEMLTKTRLEKLPNETGGILIGGYDMERKKIYIVDTILSPSDSYEYPTAYIRGIEGVENRLDEIRRVTDGNLKYVGEWHSHPKGARLNPSEDDKKLFEWLSKEMIKIGLPALMIIAGADRELNILMKV